MEDIYSGVSAVVTYANEIGDNPDYYFTISFLVRVENKKLLYLFGCTLERGAAEKIKILINSGEIKKSACVRAGKTKNSKLVKGQCRHTNIFDWRVVKRNFPELFTDFTLKQSFHTQQMSFKF